MTALNMQSGIYAHARLGDDLHALLPSHFDGWIYPTTLQVQVTSEPMFDELLDPEIMLWDAFSRRKLAQIAVTTVSDESLSQL